MNKDGAGYKMPGLNEGVRPENIDLWMLEVPPTNGSLLCILARLG